MDNVNSVKCTLNRLPSRPLHLQGEAFAANFDTQTLFYDCFRSKPHEITLIGPALFNLKSLLEKSYFTHQGKPLEVKIETFKLMTRVRIKADESVKSINLSGEIGDYTLPIRENQQADFKDMRVITTVQKDNDLIWIEDWVKFYRDVHGAEAVLIYDNGSTHYSLEALAATVTAIKGLKHVKIVSWNFIYGPGPAPNMPFSRKYWDSNFCQIAALEHARRCYLQQAKCVNFTDIDEFIVSKNEKSIFEETEKSLLGITMTAGRWVIGTSHLAETPRHHDFNVLLKVKPAYKFNIFPYDANACKTKWTIVPHKIPDFTCVDVHKIIKYPPSRLVSREFTFRHFRHINHSWFNQRMKIEEFNNETHEIDHHLMRDFAKIKE